MRRYKFADLLLFEERIKELYQKYGLSFNSSNRISKYFSYLSDIEKNRKLDKVRFSQLLQKDKAKYYYSQYYVLEICNIIDALENSIQDEMVLKGKLNNLIKGTFLLSEENINDTKARDTTFELGLFSFFYSKKLKTKLSTPNPDLQLFTKNFVYDIECKRPNSTKSLEKNIKKAVKQFKRTSQGNTIPAIALSLERVLLGDDLILHSYDGHTALSFLDKLITEFAENNLPMVKKVCGNDSYVILYCLSCLCGFENETSMSSATHITGNVYNFKEDLSRKIYDDLQVLAPNYQ